MADVTQAGRDRRWIRRLARALPRVVAGGLVLALLWGCCELTGLWRSIPGLREARIDHLDLVEGGTAHVVVSSIDHPGPSYLSPDGHWMLQSLFSNGPREQWLLLDLWANTRQRFETESFTSGYWLTPDLFYGEGFGYYLLHVPALNLTTLPVHEPVPPLAPEEWDRLRGADHVYYFAERWGIFVVLDAAYEYVLIPYPYSKDESDALVRSLPQAVTLKSRFRQYATLPPDRAQLPRTQIGSHDYRYYSPDGRFYATSTPGAGVYVHIYASAGDRRVARVYKRGYGPLLLGWSADSRGFYFQMQIGGVGEVLTSAWPLYFLELPESTRAAETAIPRRAGGLRSP